MSIVYRGEKHSAMLVEPRSQPRNPGKRSEGFRLVSIVMPVYNGEHYIAVSIERTIAVLERHGIPHEIVVVDNGSREGTRSEALRLLESTLI